MKSSYLLLVMFAFIFSSCQSRSAIHSSIKQSVVTDGDQSYILFPLTITSTGGYCLASIDADKIDYYTGFQQGMELLNPETFWLPEKEIELNKEIAMILRGADNFGSLVKEESPASVNLIAQMKESTSSCGKLGQDPSIYESSKLWPFHNSETVVKYCGVSPPAVQKTVLDETGKAIQVTERKSCTAYWDGWFNTYFECGSEVGALAACKAWTREEGLSLAECKLTFDQQKRQKSRQKIISSKLIPYLPKDYRSLMQECNTIVGPFPSQKPPRNWRRYEVPNVYDNSAPYKEVSQ